MTFAPESKGIIVKVAPIILIPVICTAVFAEALLLVVYVGKIIYEVASYAYESVACFMSDHQADSHDEVRCVGLDCNNNDNVLDA